MATVTMPDGTAVEMPDQIDPALGARLRAFQQKAAPHPDPIGAANAAANASEHGPVQDVIDMIRGVPEGIVPALKGLVGSLNPAENVANLTHAVRSLVQNPQGALDAVKNATPAQVGANVVAPTLVGGAAGEGAGLAAGMSERASAAAAAEAANPAARIGLRSTADHPVGATFAGSSAGPTLDIQNQGVASRAMGNEAGVPADQPVNHATLTTAAMAPGNVLEQGASLLPTGPLSPAARNAVAAARGSGRITRGSPIVEAYINDAESRLLHPDAQFTGEQIRAERNGMNADASAGMTSTDHDIRAKAKYQRAIVDALDQHTVDSLPPNSAISPEMIANARTTLAKNYTLRDLIGKGGDIDLQALAKDHRDNPNKYTGAMRTVAQFASDHPEVTGGVTDATRISPPGVLHDIAGVNLFKPLGSAGQALAGWAGRRILRGPDGAAMDAARSVPVAGLGGEFDLRPLDGLSPPPGQAFETHQHGQPLPEGRGLPYQEPLALQPPEGTAFEAHQHGPTLAEGLGLPYQEPLQLHSPEGRAFEELQREAAAHQGHGLPFQPPLELQPPPGVAFEPHQPDAATGNPERDFFGTGTGGMTASPPTGAPPPAAGPPGQIPLADLLSHGLEQGPSPGLSLAPEGQHAQVGIPFVRNAAHEAGDLGLAEGLGAGGPFRGKPMSMSDFPGVKMQGVPEGIVQRTSNNASGESAASLEAINRGTKNLAIIDQDGNEQALLRDVTQADRKAPKGKIIVNKDTGEIIDRGTMSKSNAQGLLNRWAKVGRTLGDNFVVGK